MIKEYVGRKADELGMVFSSLGGALVLGQFPQYLAQYLQRLGGHIDEARMASDTFRIPQLAQRAGELQRGLEAIVNASALGKLPRFIQHVDLSIARRALENYIPGITLDQQGLLYCAAGALAGMVVYEIGKPVLKKVARTVLSRRRPNLERSASYT